MAASNPAFSIPEVSGQPGIQELPHEVPFAYLSLTLANEMGIDHPPGEGVYVNPFNLGENFPREALNAPVPKGYEKMDIIDNVSVVDNEGEHHQFVMKQEHLRAAYLHSIKSRDNQEVETINNRPWRALGAIAAAAGIFLFRHLRGKQDN